MTVVPPLLMSSCVVELCAVSGSASCSFWEAGVDVLEEAGVDVLEVAVDSPAGFGSDSTAALMLKGRRVETARTNGPRCAKDLTTDCMCWGEQGLGLEPDRIASARRLAVGAR